MFNPANVYARITSATNPMPPGGGLTPDELEALKARYPKPQ
jgi:hypothetical protein